MAGYGETKGSITNFPTPGAVDRKRGYYGSRALSLKSPGAGAKRPRGALRSGLETERHGRVAALRSP